MSSLLKHALKLIARSFILLRAQSNKAINLFSKRDFIVITFFTILGMGGVFAAGLVTLTPSESQGAGYLRATTCDPAITIKSRLLNKLIALLLCARRRIKLRVISFKACLSREDMGKC